MVFALWLLWDNSADINSDLFGKLEVYAVEELCVRLIHDGIFNMGEFKGNGRDQMSLFVGLQ